MTRDCVYQDQQSQVMYKRWYLGFESTFWLRTRETALAMTFEVDRGEEAGWLQKLHTPASGRLVGSKRHKTRTCFDSAAAQADWVITGSGNKLKDGTGWNSR
jgi:hypothetical protein